MQRLPWILAVLLILIGGGFAIYYVTGSPDLPTESAPGFIEGTTLYPSEFVPAQRVCAVQTDEKAEFCDAAPEGTGPDLPTFRLEVPPGDYYVYALVENPGELNLESSSRAFWTEFVVCGLQASCPSHEPIVVKVRSGETVTDIRPHDWYN